MLKGVKGKKKHLEILKFWHTQNKDEIHPVKHYGTSGWISEQRSFTGGEGVTEWRCKLYGSGSDFWAQVTKQWELGSQITQRWWWRQQERHTISTRWQSGSSYYLGRATFLEWGFLAIKSTQKTSRSSVFHLDSSQWSTIPGAWLLLRLAKTNTFPTTVLLTTF